MCEHPPSGLSPVRVIHLSGEALTAGIEEQRIGNVAVCTRSVEEDGVTFLPETLNIEERVEGRTYRGLYR